VDPVSRDKETMAEEVTHNHLAPALAPVVVPAQLDLQEITRHPLQRQQAEMAVTAYRHLFLARP
jgi:hypothetical protein